MTFIDAALQVLEQSKEALTTRQITDRALDQGLLATAGKTPDASMSAALYKETAAAVPRVRKLSQPGPARAARGSVRWTLVER